MAANGGGMLRRLRRLFGFGGDGVERQFGAVPYRRRNGELEFLVITSRRTGRWIFPKGGRMALLSGADTAAEEAFEEAGVRGLVEAQPAGRYRDVKVREEGETVIEVEMYPMAVDHEFDEWPEMAQRRRRWVGPGEAAILLSHPQLVTIVNEIAARPQPSQDGAAGAT